MAAALRVGALRRAAAGFGLSSAGASSFAFAGAFLRAGAFFFVGALLFSAFTFLAGAFFLAGALRLALGFSSASVSAAFFGALRRAGALDFILVTVSFTSGVLVAAFLRLAFFLGLASAAFLGSVWPASDGVHLEFPIDLLNLWLFLGHD